MCRVYYYKKKTHILLLLLLFLLFNISFAEREAGLILSGLDTMQSGAGMDFVLARPCSTSGDNTCYGHFSYGWHSDISAYTASVGSPGRMLDLGKMNLDSIKSAPADSVMKDDLGLGQPYRFFRIKPDSLKQCFGNCYIIKTSIDPRRGYGMYVKMKILNFLVLDSTNHLVKMVFLWVVNRSGYPDLTSSGLDTFHLDNTPTISRHNQLTSNLISRANGGQYVFKVVGDRFVVPEELSGAYAHITVYDLKGKKLGTVATIGCRVVNLRQLAKGKGVFVVKVLPFP